MESVIPVIAALTAGFLGGLFAFRIKQQWCSVCGRTKACPAEQAHLAAGSVSATPRRYR